MSKLKCIHEPESNECASVKKKIGSIQNISSLSLQSTSGQMKKLQPVKITIKVLSVP